MRQESEQFGGGGGGGQHGGRGGPTEQSVEHWDFYRHYYTVPYREQVGVGSTQEVFLNSISDVWRFSMNVNRPKDFWVNINTLQALTAFLLIPDSYRLWSTNNVRFL